MLELYGREHEVRGSRSEVKTFEFESLMKDAKGFSPPTSNLCPPTLVVSLSHLHLAAEHAVNKHKVPERKQSADGPPDEAYTQSVRARTGVFNSEIVLMIARGQHHGIERERGAD